MFSLDCTMLCIVTYCFCVFLTHHNKPAVHEISLELAHCVSCCIIKLAQLSWLERIGTVDYGHILLTNVELPVKGYSFWHDVTSHMING